MSIFHADKALLNVIQSEIDRETDRQRERRIMTDRAKVGGCLYLSCSCSSLCSSLSLSREDSLSCMSFSCSSRPLSCSSLHLSALLFSSVTRDNSQHTSWSSARTKACWERSYTHTRARTRTYTHTDAKPIFIINLLHYFYLVIVLLWLY